MCCGESGIMYGKRIVKRSDLIIPMGIYDFYTSTNMKMVRLMIFSTKITMDNWKGRDNGQKFPCH